MINRIIRLFDQNKIFDVEELPDYKVVGMDLFGGTFLLNIDGKIDYFAPDTLEFENLGLNYNEFVHWTKNGDMKVFMSLYFGMVGKFMQNRQTNLKEYQFIPQCGQMSTMQKVLHVVLFH